MQAMSIYRCLFLLFLLLIKIKRDGKNSKISITI